MLPSFQLVVVATFAAAARSEDNDAGAPVSREGADVWDGKQFVKAADAGELPQPQISVPGGTGDAKMARLNEQELMDPNIPKRMLCDACGAISFQLGRALAKKSAGKGGQKLRSFELIDVLEGVCNSGEGELVDREGKAYDWGEYSIKEDAEGRNIIAGPGTQMEDQMGFGQYGGMKSRLMRRCTEMVGQVDEDEVYAASMAADGGGAPLSELLCADDCRQIEEEGGSRGGVEKKKKNKKKKSKKKKSKKKKSKGEL